MGGLFGTLCSWLGLDSAPVSVRRVSENINLRWSDWEFVDTPAVRESFLIDIDLIAVLVSH